MKRRSRQELIGVALCRREEGSGVGNRSGMAGGGRITGNRGARAVEAMAAVLLLSGANGKEQRGMGAGSALGEGERE